MENKNNCDFCKYNIDNKSCQKGGEMNAGSCAQRSLTKEGWQLLIDKATREGNFYLAEEYRKNMSVIKQ